jgi:hypothetical protein
MSAQLVRSLIGQNRSCYAKRQQRQVLDALHLAAGLDQIVADRPDLSTGALLSGCGNQRCRRRGFACVNNRYRLLRHEKGAVNVK